MENAPQLTPYGELIIHMKKQHEGLPQAPDRCEAAVKAQTVRYRRQKSTACYLDAICIIDGQKFCVKHAALYMFDSVFRTKTHTFGKSK